MTPPPFNPSNTSIALYRIQFSIPFDGNFSINSIGYWIGSGIWSASVLSQRWSSFEACSSQTLGEQYEIKFEFVELKLVLKHEYVENKSNCVSSSSFNYRMVIMYSCNLLMLLLKCSYKWSNRARKLEIFLFSVYHCTLSYDAVVV